MSIKLSTWKDFESAFRFILPIGFVINKLPTKQDVLNQFPTLSWIGPVSHSPNQLVSTNMFEIPLPEVKFYIKTSSNPVGVSLYISTIYLNPSHNPVSGESIMLHGNSTEVKLPLSTYDNKTVNVGDGIYLYQHIYGQGWRLTYHKRWTIQDNASVWVDIVGGGFI